MVTQITEVLKLESSVVEKLVGQDIAFVSSAVLGVYSEKESAELQEATDFSLPTELVAASRSDILNQLGSVGSIDASALAVEKADALQVCEKAVANTLYKLGENIDAFDDAAFLADVDAYKATKDIALTATVDYLKQQLDIRTTLTA